MDQGIQTIAKYRIVPVVVVDSPQSALGVCQALVDGGLPLAEITFRTEAAAQAIAAVSREFPQMLVGAGTVLSLDQARAALDAGAKFIVSPGFSSTLVRFCQDNRVPVTPGCSTPTDLTAAFEHGLDVVKFFPAEASGGLSTLKAVAAPFKMLKFIPTGGIDASNLRSYLAFEQVIACGGSWMVKSDLVKAEDWASVRRLTSEALDIACAS